jgi:hypothetical protein
MDQYPPETQTTDYRRPKILSVTEPAQSKLSKPRVLLQFQSSPQQEIQASKLSEQQVLSIPTSSDPVSEADWTEQTLTQAEKDAEEQRMTDDIFQTAAIPANSPAQTQGQTPRGDPSAAKADPTSVHGVLYALRGMAVNVCRKLTGK